MGPVWEAGDIQVAIDLEQTDHPLITFVIKTPATTLLLMAAVALGPGSLTLSGLNIHGAAANVIGPGNLLRMARAVMDEMEIDEIVIEGAIRTTGAAPGRLPRRFRITRGPKA